MDVMIGLFVVLALVAAAVGVLAMVRNNRARPTPLEETPPKGPTSAPPEAKETPSAPPYRRA